MSQDAAVDGVRIFAGLHHEFVEARRAGEEHFRMLAELRGGVSGLGQILFGQFLQPDFAVDGHEDVDHQRHQRLIGADIRSRLLAPNMLLAGGQG